MNPDRLTPASLTFLDALWERSQGQASRQVSMYDIGAALGLDREASAQAAEDLMGVGLVEVRTLSGGIGLTAAAVERFQAASASQAPAEPGLGPGPVLEAGPPRQHLERLLVELKHHLAGEDRDFAGLAALVATLGSIDAQLASPRPRTAVLRACLEALAEDCRAGGEADWASRLGRLLERP